MTENPETEKATKGSFVDPKDYEEKRPQNSPIRTIKVGDKEVQVLPPEVALTLVYGKLDAILTELKMLNGIFKEAKEPKSFQSPAPSQQPIQPTTGNSPEVNPLRMPPPVTEQTPRVKEILAALAPVADLLKIDTEGSTMFVMVKPSTFLGPENFAKVAKIVREIGGQYMSAGKNSHFEISKAPLRK